MTSDRVTAEELAVLNVGARVPCGWQRYNEAGKPTLMSCTRQAVYTLVVLHSASSYEARLVLCTEHTAEGRSRGVEIGPIARDHSSPVDPFGLSEVLMVKTMTQFDIFDFRIDHLVP